MINRWNAYSLAGMLLLGSCTNATITTDSITTDVSVNTKIAVFPQDEPPSLSPSDFVRWVEDPGNNLTPHVVINGIQYQLKYTPVELVALRQLSRQNTFTSDDFERKKNELKNYQYFVLSIGTASGIAVLKAGTRSEHDRDSRLRYFCSGMQHDIKLVEDIDTMHCAMYQFENLNGLAAHSNFVLAFPKRTSRGGTYPDKRFILNDVVFNNGLITLDIKGSDLRKIPNLDLKIEE